MRFKANVAVKRANVTFRNEPKDEFFAKVQVKSTVVYRYDEEKVLTVGHIMQNK